MAVPGEPTGRLMAGMVAPRRSQDRPGPGLKASRPTGGTAFGRGAVLVALVRGEDVRVARRQVLECRPAPKHAAEAHVSQGWRVALRTAGERPCAEPGKAQSVPSATVST